MARVTIEDVRSKLLEHGNELLETEYIGCKEPMRYKCLKHNVEHFGKWSDIKANKACCPLCKREKISKANMHSYEYVLDFIKGIGYTLISKEYNGNKKKLSIHCPVHDEFKMTFDMIQQGQRCPKCMREHQADSQRRPYEEVVKMFENRNYTLISDKYINCDSPLAYKCNIHPEKIQYIRLNNLNHDKGCKDCYIERVSGENSHLWKGGLTPQSKLARNQTVYKDWQKKVFERDDYTCKKCDKRGGKLNAHHILNFSDFIELRYEVSNGITLCRECHLDGDNSFHKIYTVSNNTLEQLEEFLGYKLGL